VRGVIEGTNEETELTDSNYDGEIDENDIAQIELIIVGEETELTVIDTSRIPVTIKKPLERVVVTVYTLETLRSIKVPKDVIVGLGSAESQMHFFPEYQDVPKVATSGKGYGFNLEEVLNLNPDAVISRGTSIEPADRAVYEAAGIPALVFDSNTLTNLSQTLKIEGYIFDKREEVEEFLDFQDGLLNSIEERVKDLPEEDKPNVYYGCRYSNGDMLYNTYLYYYSRIDVTGGIDIFNGMNGQVSPEAIIEQNPDIIISPMPGGIYQGQKYGYLPLVIG
jgi:iron complex transport system substrate-binding protein